MSNVLRTQLFNPRSRALLAVFVFCMRYVVVPVALLPGVLGYGFFRVFKLIKRALCGVSKPPDKLVSDKSPYHQCLSEKDRKKIAKEDANVEYEHRTSYVKMSDGTRIAVDLMIPKLPGHTEPLRYPVVLHQTRYHRSLKFWWALKKLFWPHNGKPVDLMNSFFKMRFLRNRFAVVSVDVRGTGASEGTFTIPWGREERKDSREIIDWICQQPFSNGEICLFGISYDGTNALFTAEQRHPAIKAAIPMFPFLDLYEDLGAPGGTPLLAFGSEWATFCEAQDANWPGGNEAALSKWLFPVAVDGVSPVQGHEGELSGIVQRHTDNWDCQKDLGSVTCRDVVLPSADITPAELYEEAVENVSHDMVVSNHRIPMLFVTGWVDASTRGSLVGFHRAMDATYAPRSGVVANPRAEQVYRTVLASSASSDSQLVVGPWNHGATQHNRLHKNVRSVREFQMTQMIDRFLGKFFTFPSIYGPPDKETNDPVQYYMMGAEKWMTSSSWPPPQVECLTFHLHRPKMGRGPQERFQSAAILSPYVDPSPATDTPQWAFIERVTNTDEAAVLRGHSRWNAMTALFKDIDYTVNNMEDASSVAAKNRVVFTTERLESPLDIVGQVMAGLRVKFGRPASDPQTPVDDVYLFVHVLGITNNNDSDDEVYYITEGSFAVSHRKPAQNVNAVSADLPNGAFGHSVNSDYNAALHTFNSSDRQHPQELDKPVDVKFALMPVAMSVPTGDKLCIVVSGSDTPHFASCDAAEGLRIGLSLRSCRFHVPVLGSEAASMADVAMTVV